MNIVGTFRFKGTSEPGQQVAAFDLLAGLAPKEATAGHRLNFSLQENRQHTIHLQADVLLVSIRYAMYSPSDQDYIQQLSIDCVIFGYQENQLNVLVPKLDFRGDFWALPSGFISQGEGIAQAARRILEDRTGIRDIYLEQFSVFGDAERSNAQVLERLISLNEDKLDTKHLSRKELEWITRRFVSIGYYALVDISKVIPRKNDVDASIEWYPVKQLPAMIMDHNAMVAQALETLRLNLDQKLIGFNLLPETFTMKEVQELYEAIFDKPLARNNFQKKILGLNVVQRLEKKFTGAANKAPYLYRWKR